MTAASFSNIVNANGIANGINLVKGFLITLLVPLVKLSAAHHVWVVCDFAQHIYLPGYSFELKAVLDEKLKDAQRVTLRKNLRNTYDISTVLSVVRDSCVGSESGDILPKKKYGHFIRGPLTKIHFLCGSMCETA